VITSWHDRAGEGVSPRLVALTARKQSVDLGEIGARSRDELIQELRLVFEASPPFDGHRKAFIEPARNSSAARCAP
jgi:hypothetical protein